MVTRCRFYEGLSLRKTTWSGRIDSNYRPSVSDTDALPGCATPRQKGTWSTLRAGQGSNLRPTNLEAVALPTELPARNMFTQGKTLLPYSILVWF